MVILSYIILDTLLWLTYSIFPCYASQGSCSWSRSELLPEAWSGTKIWSSEVRVSVLCSWRILPGRFLSEEAEPFGEASGGPGGLCLHQIHARLSHHCPGGQGSLARLIREGELVILRNRKRKNENGERKNRKKTCWSLVRSPLDHYLLFSCWCSPYWHWRNSRQRLSPSEIPGNCWRPGTFPPQRSSSWWRGRSSSDGHPGRMRLAGGRDK